MSQQPPKRRKCGACKGVGHDRRNCPALRATKADNLAIPAVENRNGLDGGPSRLPIGATMPEIIPNINWDKVFYLTWRQLVGPEQRTISLSSRRWFWVRMASRSKMAHLRA
ncbi:hypothetical protein IV203_037864 [Nitzschia inconspicua]|uniref:CCHC-type domain-containing protein n=1 Tax=Nitzschia inconspicua TaxID=303405 RepID=A0A9K3PYI9_9STRA|nr:hypothetical protein IV203_037864 [Nitzschia inconspicua]